MTVPGASFHSLYDFSLTTSTSTGIRRGLNTSLRRTVSILRAFISFSTTRKSNVATAHPTAAELRGMIVPSLCSFVFLKNPKVSFGQNLPFLLQRICQVFG